MHVGLSDANARVVLPLFQSLLVAKEAHDQAAGVLLFFPSRGASWCTHSARKERRGEAELLPGGRRGVGQGALELV